MTLLVVTAAVAGRVNVACALARRLRAAGHEVTLAARRGVAGRAGREGLPFLEIGPAPGAGRRRLRGRRAARVAALRLDEYAAALAELAPTAVLVDMELHAHVMATVGAGARAVLWTDMLSVWKRPGLPPLHHDVTPGEGWRGTRPGIEWAWLRYRAWKRLRFGWERLRRLGADERSVLEEVAAATGFPLREEAVWDQWLIPFTFRSLPVLELNALELEFPHDPYPTVRYLGPVLDRTRPAARATSGADRARLDAVYESRRTGATSALLYAAFGAWHRGDTIGLWRRVVDAVAARPDWALVAGLGGRADPDRLGALPPNVTVLDWAPQFEVLDHADLALHHGGINTINECIDRGVPMLAYPVPGRDTVGAARRMAFHGLGAVGEPGDTAADMRGRIERLLGDPATAASVERFRRHFAAYEESGAVIAAIESLAAV